MHAAVLHVLGKPPRFEEFPDLWRAKAKCSYKSARLR